jgi:glucose/arabinose dehydrogenase
MKNPFDLLRLAFALAVLAPFTAFAATSDRCAGDNGGLTLPPGFCATIFADGIGHARHLVAAPDGVVYVNTWSGRYFRDKGPPSGGFLVALKDTDGDGHADVVQRFGNGIAQGSAGGTGIALFRGSLYVEQNDRILRYSLNAGALVPAGKARIVVSGLPLGGDHPMHPFVIDSRGNLFVDVGSASNACQLQNRMSKSPGTRPCAELKTRGGIWRYSALRTGQKFSPAERYATGIRNGEGMGFDADGRLFVTQHGRDQLGENWPDLYTPEQGHELPAEVFVELDKGADYGWPECYYDGFHQRLVLAPEYGGDGGHAIGGCADKHAPVANFPAHWAPNDLVIYLGKQFPDPYRGGAFIAFHGSWNRAPAPQGGYNVVFQPLSQGKASGDYVVFADGFAGPGKAQGEAAYRPSGLAVGPDGALFVSDDSHGRIWRITYRGGADARAGRRITNAVAHSEP